MKKYFKIITSENKKTWDRIISLDEGQSFPTYSNKKNATEKEKFDYCIKEEFLNGKTYLPGIKLANRDLSNFGFYLSRYKRDYDRYFSNRLEIESTLSSEIKKKYDEGKGNEFESGKFYSVASSSRFAVSSFSEKSNIGIIELLKKIKINGKVENVEIILEEGLNIEGVSNNSTPPQMDVVIKTETGDTYFIEVKCHEIFDTSKNKNIKLKWKYFKTAHFMKFPLKFDKLSKMIEKNSEYISLDKKHLNAESFKCNISTTHFDFKQFLCHLMGILSYKAKNNNEKLHFYYLFYKNEEYLNLTNGSKNIYSELEAEMSEIFGRFGKLFNEIDFGYCYSSKFDTLESLEKENT